MDLQPMTTSPCRHSPSLSREGNVLHAFINQLSHACPLQKENIPLHTVPNFIGICRQQTKFATFTLSLQRGKRMACFSSYSFCILAVIQRLLFAKSTSRLAPPLRWLAVSGMAMWQFLRTCEAHGFMSTMEFELTQIPYTLIHPKAPIMK